MYAVAKTFRVSCGHRLSKHEGLCHNFHGHNLKVEVKICARNLNENGMVIDFTELKQMIHGIVSDWDHALLLNVDDEEFTGYMKEKNMKTVAVPGEPTAERLCSELYLSLTSKLIHSHAHPVHVAYVRIWENDDSMAEYAP